MTLLSPNSRRLAISWYQEGRPSAGAIELWRARQIRGFRPCLCRLVSTILAAESGCLMLLQERSSDERLCFKPEMSYCVGAASCPTRDLPSPVVMSKFLWAKEGV